MSDSACMAFIDVVYILLMEGNWGIKNRFSKVDADTNF